MQVASPARATPAAMAAGASSYLRTARGEGELTGADATYSVPLAGGRTAWVFGDSFVGGIQPDGSRSHDPTTFVRNSIVLQDSPDSFRLVTGRRDGERVDAAIPPGMRVNRDGSLPDEWYWPGHGTTRGDELLVFMNRFDHPPERGDVLSWDWRYRGTDLARFDAASGALRSTHRILEGGDVLWGAAVLDRDDATYVFGAEDDPADGTRHAHVARVDRERLDDPAAWRFWDGSDWSTDRRSSARIGPRVSPQFGAVEASDGSLLLVTQDGFDPTIRAWRADRPEGPWEGPVELARIPDQPAGRHTYNAVPHPQLSDDGSLVVSYNVGGSDFMTDHTSYRPGFLTVPAATLPGGGARRSAT